MRQLDLKCFCYNSCAILMMSIHISIFLHSSDPRTNRMEVNRVVSRIFLKKDFTCRVELIP